MSTQQITEWLQQLRAANVTAPTPPSPPSSPPKLNFKRRRPLTDIDGNSNTNMLPRNPDKMTRTPSPRKIARFGDYDNDTEQTPRPASRQLRSRSQSPSKTRSLDGLDGLDTIHTAIPVLSPISMPFPMPPLSTLQLTDSPRTEKSFSTKSTASTKSGRSRSKSPVKEMADFNKAQKSWTYETITKLEQLPACVRHLYTDLCTIRHNVAVVPAAIQDHVREKSHASGPLMPHMIESASTTCPAASPTTTKLLSELDRLGEVVAQTNTCISEGLAEPGWNEAVHYPLLNTTFNHPTLSGIIHFNLTTASQLEKHAHRDTHGDILQMRKIDYGICVGEPIIAKQSVLDFLHRADATSVSPTDYAPLRNRPLAVSIETKTHKSAHDPVVQVSTWAATHFNMLRHFRDVARRRRHLDMTSSEGKGKGKGKGEDGDDGSLPALPLLSVSGYAWNLNFIVDTTSSIYVWSAPFSIGDTRTIIGAYTALASLRRIGEWVRDEFAVWFRREILDD